MGLLHELLLLLRNRIIDEVVCCICRLILSIIMSLHIVIEEATCDLTLWHRFLISHAGWNGSLATAISATTSKQGLCVSHWPFFLLLLFTLAEERIWITERLLLFCSYHLLNRLLLNFNRILIERCLFVLVL